MECRHSHATPISLQATHHVVRGIWLSSGSRFLLVESFKASDTCGVGKYPTRSSEGRRESRLVAIQIAVAKGLKSTRSSPIQQCYEKFACERLPSEKATVRA